MDILSNLVRSLSLSNGSRQSASIDSPVLAEKEKSSDTKPCEKKPFDAKPFDPFAITSSNTELEIDETDEIIAHNNSFGSGSSKDNSFSEPDQHPRFHATVGPRLVELDPAVAHASQMYQPFSLDDGF